MTAVESRRTVRKSPSYLLSRKAGVYADLHCQGRNAEVNGEDRKLVVHAARNGFFYALDRVNGSFIAGKQYVDQLNWTPGLDPKTGKPEGSQFLPPKCEGHSLLPFG
jgi:hypothetical protein